MVGISVHRLNGDSDERAIVGIDCITHHRCTQTPATPIRREIFTANHGETICIAASMSRMDT